MRVCVCECVCVLSIPREDTSYAFGSSRLNGMDIQFKYNTDAVNSR